MPNHVTQILTVEGTNATERMRAYFTDFDVASDLPGGKREQWRGFDFGKIIPRPPVVDTVVENGADRYIPFLMDLDQAYVLWEKLRLEKWSQLAERPLPPWQGFSSMRDGWMERHLRHTFGDEPIDNAHRMIRCFAETGHKGWYGWSCANWGTKWNAYSSDTDPQGGQSACKIKFDTAWACPEPVLKRLASLEPTLAFSYVAFDEGHNFYARGAGHDGTFNLDVFKGPFSEGDAEMIAAHIECYGEAPEPDEEDDDLPSPTRDEKDS